MKAPVFGTNGTCMQDKGLPIPGLEVPDSGNWGADSQDTDLIGSKGSNTGAVREPDQFGDSVHQLSGTSFWG